jgi:hypothetical protein
MYDVKPPSSLEQPLLLCGSAMERLHAKESGHDSEGMPRHSIPSLFPAEGFPTAQENSPGRDYPERSFGVQYP